MSKEFEEWWESEKEKMRKGEGIYFSSTVHPGDLRRAFDAGITAGRALGRREAVDKVSENQQGYSPWLVEEIAAAIEAIPEEP